MADDFVQCPPNSTGKKMAAKTVVNGGGDTVLRQEMAIADPLVAANVLQVFAEDAAHTSGDKGLLILGVRNDDNTSSPVSSNGDYHAIQFNDKGRVKVSAAPADIALTTGSITTIGNTVPVDVSRAGSLVAYVSGTFTTANCIFEGSLDSTNGTDGTWFGIQAARTNANTVEATTGNLSAAPAYGWKIGTNGMNWVRVRATAIASGTQNWQLAPSATAIDPTPGVAAHAVTSTAVAAPTVVAGQFYQSVSPTLNQGPTLLKAKVISAASTNSTLVLTGVRRLVGGILVNNNAAIRYFKIYEKATAPTVGTDIPTTLIPLPPNQPVNVAAAIGNCALNIALGLGYGITAGSADGDTTAVGAGDVVGTLIYI